MPTCLENRLQQLSMQQGTARSFWQRLVGKVENISSRFIQNKPAHPRSRIRLKTKSKYCLCRFKIFFIRSDLHIKMLNTFQLVHLTPMKCYWLCEFTLHLASMQILTDWCFLWEPVSGWINDQTPCLPAGDFTMLPRTFAILVWYFSLFIVKECKI